MNNVASKIYSNMKYVVISIIGLILLFSAIYTVDEGNVGIVKRFGEAVNSVDPGVHLKVPFIDNIKEIDVRTHKYQLKMSASTTGRKEGGGVELQMPSSVVISANWNIPKNSALEIYKKFGGLEQYEDRMLDPRVLRSTKQIFAKHSIEEIISSREIVRGEIANALTDALSGKLVSMTDINIEDIEFSQKIKTAIENKQTSKLSFEAEQYNLDKQNLEAQRTVNTATAEAESRTKRSIAEAAAIQREGDAVAMAMSAKGKALKENPGLVLLIHEERWNGVLPTHVLSDGSNLLLSVDKK